MASKVAPLLCELHAHTTWSDGRRDGAELVVDSRLGSLRAGLASV
jgi:hypothetical protein